MQQPSVQETGEKQRLDQWKERYARIKPGFSYKPQADRSYALETNFQDPDVTQQHMAETQRSALCAATGTASEKYGGLLLGQTMSGFFTSENYDNAFIANAVHEALLAMNPADEYEGMLCSRLLVLHDQYMNYMNRSAAPNQSSEGIDLNINRATKLMRLYNETLEALNRYRRKGEQKVTVQHVNINDGGKAVITGSMPGGGGHDKKQGSTSCH
jgi:hypothetical protein